MLIRRAEARDAESIAAIFNFEIERGGSHYETRPHTAQERKEWLERMEQGGYPILVAENGVTLLGFAALTPFHSLSGYRFTVTGSIYVACGSRRLGVGSALAAELIKAAQANGYHSILAGVNSENQPCIALLRTFGFEKVGYFREIGTKNGQWCDDVCLQLILSQS